MLKVEQSAILAGHQNPVYTVEAPQKPGIIFTGGNDKGVVEWSLEKKEFIKVLFPVQSSVYALHCPPLFPILVSGERSGQLSIWDFELQKITCISHHHKLPIFDIKSVGSKKELLVASEDGTVSVYNLNSGKTDYPFLYSFQVSSEMVRNMSISPDEKLVAFGCKDNRIKIYNLEDYSVAHDFEAHTLPVTSVLFSPDGQHLLSGSRDAHINIWNIQDFSLEKTIPAHLFAIYSLAYHPTKPYFASASRDKNIKIWSADDFSLKKIISIEKGFQSHRHSVNKIIWEANNEQLISVSDDKLVMIWDVQIDG